MSIFATMRVALRALLKNRLRSALTMLGIIIGVGAFVAMVAIGQGVRAAVAASFDGMGSNVVMIFPGSSTSGGARGGMGSASTLTLLDAESVGRLQSVRVAAPVVQTGAQLVAGASNWSASVMGTTPAFLEVRSWPLEQGDMFTEEDARRGAKLCVLGQTVVENLFGAGATPIGEMVRVKGLPCQVVGVLSKKGASSWGRDEDDLVMMPIATVRRRLLGGDPNIVNQIFVSAVAPESMAEATQQIEQLMRQRHKIGEADPDDFVVRDPSVWAKQSQDMANMLTGLLGSIAFISLIVGGIGIMNIMMVSVTERTREIGIRVALGAHTGDILTQFVVEAVLLCTLGGLFGVGLGVVGAGWVAKAMGWPKLISAGTLGIGFTFAALVGVIFGLYPALRASRLDPIEALRYE